MRDLIIETLRNRFAAYSEFVDELDENLLTNHLAVTRNKSIKEHLWCLVGARESYARALQHGHWLGFTCSMTTYSKQDFQHSLKSSAAAVLASIEEIEQWSADQEALLAKLAEHEVMHEGQLIRHVYGLGGTLPQSWSWA